MRIATFFTASLLATALVFAQQNQRVSDLLSSMEQESQRLSGQKQRIAVLPSVGELEAQRLNLLTDKVREIANKSLPTDKFILLRQDAVMEIIGDKDYFTACQEGTCIGELAKKANANYGARCDVFKIDNNLVLKFELYSVKDEAILETFTDYNAKDFLGMLALLEQRLPSAFGKMPGASLVSTVSAPDLEHPQSFVPSAPTPTPQIVNEVATPKIDGTIVPGNSLADKLTWLQRSADSHNTYILDVTSDESIAPHNFEYKGTINITIVVRGVGANRIIRLKSHGTMFTVKSNVTFVLENNITLQGHNGNTGALVNLNGGTFIMKTGATITGNTSSGVSLTSGTFEMNGGTISGNKASIGGGVYMYADFNNKCAFTMSGGTILGNTANKNGGGVYGDQRGNGACPFTITGGTISGNTAQNGGGVYADRNTFNMRGGTITNNIAHENGGGVYKRSALGNFIKTGGTITGYNSDQNNGNVVRDNDGVLARRGHAVYVDENRRKEITIEQGYNLSTNSNTGWDNEIPSGTTVRKKSSAVSEETSSIVRKKTVSTKK